MRRFRTLAWKRGWRMPVWLTAAAIAVAAAPADGQQRTLRGEIDLTIGVIEGEPEYLFEDIGGLTRDADGRIYVGDSGAREVRVYGPDGRYLFQVSGPGEGPGEFSRGTCGILFDPDGHLWVNAWDSYKVFDVLEDRANYVREVPPPDERRQVMAEGNRPIATAGGTICVNPMFAGPTGLTLATDSVSVGERDELLHHRQHAIIESSGAVGTRITLLERDLGATNWPVAVWRHPDHGRREMGVQPPFASRNIWVHTPDARSAHLYTREYLVQLFTEEGDVWREIRRDIPGPLITEAEARRERERLEAMRRAFRDMLIDFPSIEMPERKPPVGDMWYDEDGRLWVRLAWAEADEVLRAHVYDPDGALLFTAEWPRGIDLTLGGVSGDVALGVQRMEFDVQRVVRLRFSPR
ncbi:6-bladed beta-propeller [Candidatus Palauibacter sp.]|uniref:6-bladed beta-propeller n=1 Tax=Candidatus Palauibacter sp. TaxID=3101350 RepID=UPI003B017FB6